MVASCNRHHLQFRPPRPARSGRLPEPEYGTLALRQPPRRLQRREHLRPHHPTGLRSSPPALDDGGDDGGGAVALDGILAVEPAGVRLRGVPGRQAEGKQEAFQSVSETPLHSQK